MTAAWNKLPARLCAARETWRDARNQAVRQFSEECKTFEAGFESMQKGWGGTFEQLGEYLAKT